ncbi:GNAT family N-acetyltransferase [Geodermatophilus sp. SYSU D01119]
MSPVPQEKETTVHVRPATRDDLPAAAQVLAGAFTGYAWTRWTVDPDDHVRRLTQLQRLYLAAVALPHGEVDLGVTEEGLAAVAVWFRPSAVPAAVWADVGPAAAAVAGDRAGAAAAADATLAPHRPTGDHVVLASVGVAPGRQGSGRGGQVLAPGLSRADQAGLPVHLETSAARNRRFYRRLGFEETAVVDLPDGGPRTWLMRREPHAVPGGPP